MSFLSGLRGMMGSRPGLSENWIIPEQSSDLDELFESGTHVIYKHSYNCAVCIFSKTRVEEVLEEQLNNAKFYFLDVVRKRALSREVATRSGIHHESPQVIVFKNGRVVWHASHSAIRKDELRDAINSV